MKSFIKKGKNLTVDGYSYTGAGIDLDYYKYCAVEYYYDSRTPIKDQKMYAAIMKNGNVLKNAVYAYSDNKIVAGNWVIALFDFSEGIKKEYNAETDDHIMRQMHLRPLGSDNLQTLSVDDRVYISRIMFFQEKPDFQTHEAYMNGYPDGTFLPDGTITRVEACTVVARLLEKEEAIAGTSAFADVAGHWAEKYIGFCEAKGLLKSYSGKFVVRGNTVKAFDWKTELDKNFEFVHLANSKMAGDLPDLGTARGPLYFRCDNGNPGKVFDSIEMNERGHTISIGGPSVHIDNICIKHAGSHGISSGTTENLTVTNCEIAWIGGAIQTYNLHGSTGGRATRFGNGVEIYGGCDGYKVDNCYIWQNYDAGVTHQLSASSSGNCTMDNIVYSNNVITDTVYSIEYFLGNADDGGTYIRNGKNHLFEGNLLRRAGFGFGSTRPDGNVQTHIRTGAGTKNEFSNYVIRNNIFDRSVEYLIHPHSDYDATAPKMEGNIYIQGVDNKFFHYGKGHIANANLAAKNSMLTVLGDTTGQFYYVDTIPYWQFDYVIDKKVEVSADDTKDWGGKSGVSSGTATPSTPSDPTKPGNVTANTNESKEIVAPLLLRLANDSKNKLYADLRASMNAEVKKDDDGTNYVHVTFNNTANTVLFDCHGLPKYSLESGVVYYKALIRTNVTGKKPHITVYNMADKDGTKVGNGVSGTAPNNLKGDGQWEEVIIKVTDFPEEAVTSTQIHFFLFGNTKGENLFKDGKLIVDNAYLDVAAWAAFPNLASAEAFDIRAAAKAEIK